MTMNINSSVLIIDDDIHVCNLISNVLSQAGYTTYTANDWNKGREIFCNKFPNVVILDLYLPDFDGIKILKQIMQINREIPVIIVTAYGDIQTAVEAIKIGAYDYLGKPFDNNKVLLSVKNAIEDRAMRVEIHTLKTHMKLALPLFEQMGYSSSITRLNEQVECIAPTNFTIVVYGETGSGKEIVARNIHHRSHRKDKPFVVVDCGSIPETLIESELFGYEKGAFTGADQKNSGLFEVASGGTLFFDEVGNIPMSIQGKLLRVLQERRIRRLGSSKEIDVDVRIIVAGNERLESLVDWGKFRVDFYQRLCEFYVEIPPLRSRKEDIVFLCNKFMEITNKELNKNVRGLSKETLEMLLAYDWPGNVRELKNVIRRAVLLAGDTIEPRHIILNHMKSKRSPVRISERFSNISYHNLMQNDFQELKINFDEEFSFHDVVSFWTAHVEKRLIIEALKLTKGNKSHASKLLKLDYKTLHYRIKKYGIKT